MLTKELRECVSVGVYCEHCELKEKEYSCVCVEIEREKERDKRERERDYVTVRHCVTGERV